LVWSRANDTIAYTHRLLSVKAGSVKGKSAMKQLRRVSIVFAIIASVLAFISGAILFFVIEPPFLASIFLACAAIAIGCFMVSAVAAYFSADDISD
jgi:tetrahydromethanopterin S-methyltransferase subunit D